MTRRPRPIITELMVARRGLGLTQEAVARRIGCSDSAVARWEAGWSDPTFAHMLAYAELVGCRIEVVPVEMATVERISAAYQEAS